MKFKLPSYLLLLALLFSLTTAPAAAAFQYNTDTLCSAQDVPTAIQQAQDRLPLRITDQTKQGIDRSTLTHLEAALNYISFDLY